MQKTTSDSFVTIPERKRFPFEIRHLIYFSPRIVFTIERSDSKVIVYRVYHGSRRRLLPRDLH